MAAPNPADDKKSKALKTLHGTSKTVFDWAAPILSLVLLGLLVLVLLRSLDLFSFRGFRPPAAIDLAVLAAALWALVGVQRK